ncbi:hypothetical protein ESCO_001765 [Escovopsis weberi]|uniref:BZIP transcription factor n=1 Tax=Escovopsis weberi TaxID=150374 RepID=A0A0M8N7Z8_ESCWE|nr:hypothetical protein ESCO_001765 [Escovopsis weberi]
MSDGDPVTTTSPAAAELGGIAGKKRKMVTGSRGVAHLTPEQLAKKRANDREAQRAIRERTKNTIEALQQKIHELTNMDHMLELQKAQQARECVERENADIKRRLVAIMGMLEPLVHAQMEPQPCIPPTPQAYAPSVAIHSTGALSYNSPSTTHSASPAASLQQQQPQPQPQPQQHIHQPPIPHWQQACSGGRTVTPFQAQLQAHLPATSPGSLSAGVIATFDDFTRSQLEQQRQGLQHGFEMGQERLNLNYVLSHDNHGGSLTGIPKIERGIHGAQDSPGFHHVPMKHDWTQVNQVGQQGQQAQSPGQSMPVRPENWDAASSRFDSSGSSVSAAPSSTTVSIPSSHEHSLTTLPASYSRHEPHGPGMAATYLGITRGLLPPFAIPTNNCLPTGPLDSLLLDCINERRQRRQEGLEAHKVVGPHYPSVSSLLNPENARYSHPLSKFFTDILAKFPDIANLPERIAVLYVMFVFMRWQCLLSSDTYNLLPEWMIPRPIQLTKPHPIWIDYLPFPVMRERLVELYNPVDYCFENFFVPYTKTLILSWPYEGTDTLLQDPASDEIMINPVFFRHLRNLDNWKLVGNDFEKAFPKLAGSYNKG